MTLVALFAGIATTLLVMVLYRSFGPGGGLQKQKILKERLQTAQIIASSESVGSTSLLKKFNLSDIDLFKNILEKNKLSQQVAVSLKTLKWKISVSVLFLIGISIAVVLFLLIKAQFSPLGAFVISAFCGCLPLLYLRILHRRYVQKFTDFLPDTLSIISSSIKVGHGLEAAMNVAATSAPYPVCEEFRAVQGEVALGLSLQEALSNLYKRMASAELKILVTGISIQQEIGGNLSEILDNLEKTMRDRFALQREISALSSQGVMTAWVLFGIPIVMALIWMWRDAAMFMGFLNSSGGRIGLWFSIFCQVIGFIWIKKIVNLKE